MSDLKCIIVATGPTAEFSTAQDVALAQARESGARVIIYDVTHDGRMTDARPNFWAGEGEAELYDRPLDPVAIEKLGYDYLAVQVQRARDGGVDAFGWLPNDPGGKGLADYAMQENADLVLLPAGTDVTAKYVDDLRGSDDAAAVAGIDKIRLVDAEATLVPLS
ncbi:MAG: hypothetical protein QOG49_1280 [Frankiaceae bacterium]|nr:hypothetical protein [Frankiaceae bacterium]